MAQSRIPEETKQLSLQIGNFSELYNYEKIRILGSGGFAKVYLVRRIKETTSRKERHDISPGATNESISKEQDANYAAKVQGFVGGPALNRREASILKRLVNPKRNHVVQFKEYFEGDTFSIILMEYLTGGELFQYISSKNYRLTEAKCGYFGKQILEAIEFIHEKRIIHLDLKPENIVLCQRPNFNSVSSGSPSKSNSSDQYTSESYNERLKVIDFGIARYLGSRHRLSIGCCGTLEFISPEVLGCSHASFASDMWSVGVLFYMMVSGGISPFWDGTEKGTERNILRAKFVRGGFTHTSFREISKEAKECISMLLNLEPKLRLSAAQCLKHPWLHISKNSTSKNLETGHLRKYLARRRWKRYFNAIVAMNRMLRNGIFEKNNDGDIILKEGMFGDYGELGFFV